MRRMHLLRRVGVLACLLLTAGCGAAAAPAGGQGGSAGSAASFYKGKTITFIVPHPVGGGFDLYSRLIAQTMEKYMPGTTVVVENKPGAGGTLGEDLIYTAKPDGLTIGIWTGTGAVLDQIHHARGVRWQADKVTWLASITADPSVLVMGAKTSYTTAAKVIGSRQKVKFASSGKGSDDYVALLAISRALGFPAEVVTGYKGTHGTEQAILTGEVDGMLSSYGSVRSMVVGHRFVPVAQIAEKPSPILPHVPTLLSLAKTPTQKQRLGILTTLYELPRVIGGPPGIPASRAAYLGSVLKKALNDPGLVAKAKKAGHIVQYENGRWVATRIKQLTSQAQSLKSILAGR